MSMFFLEDDELNTVLPIDDCDVQHNHAFKAKRVKTKKFLIKLFHGTSPGIVSRMTKAFGPNTDSDYAWEFEGTYDELAEKIGEKFMVVPAPNVSGVNVVYVTHAANFNPR